MFATQSPHYVHVVDTVDLHQYPVKQAAELNNHVLVIGDLHANALKLMHILIRHNRLDLSKEQYATLVNCYKIIELFCYLHIAKLKLSALQLKVARHPELADKTLPRIDELMQTIQINEIRFMQLTDEPIEQYTKEKIQTCLQRFDDIVANATVVGQGEVILLGDDVNDRGAENNSVVSVYKKLTASNIVYTICHANHQLGMFALVESAKKLSELSFINYCAENASSFHTALLIKFGLLDDQQMKNDFHIYCAKRTKLVAYLIDKSIPNDPALIRLTHAGVGVITDKECAKTFDVAMCNQTIEAFAESLDNINHVFQQYVDHKTVYANSRLDEIDEDDFAFHAPYEFPILRYGYTREDYETHRLYTFKKPGATKPYSEYNDEMPERMGNFRLGYMHGHHSHHKLSEEKYKHYVVDLNNALGGGRAAYIGTYETWLINARSSLTLEERIQAAPIITAARARQAASSDSESDSSTTAFLANTSSAPPIPRISQIGFLKRQRATAHEGDAPSEKKALQGDRVTHQPR